MNCVYIKLSPYLADYWYKKRNIPHGQPLTLPDKEYMDIICSSLKHNPTLYRDPAKNKKGYLKDNICYSEYAYRFSSSKKQPPLQFDKVPTLEELPYLYPFLIPSKTCVKGKDVATDTFYELKPGNADHPLRGYAGVRKYIMTEFYHELNKYLNEAAMPFIREGKTFSVRPLIMDFLHMYEIGEYDYDTIRVETYQRTDISRLKYLARGYGDIDSIGRTLNSRKSSGQLL